MSEEVPLGRLFRFSMDRVEEWARAAEGPDERWAPRVFAVRAGETDGLIELELRFENEEMKHAVFDDLRQWILDEDIHLFCTVLVGHAVQLEKGQHPEAPVPGPLRDHPERQELVLVVAQDADETRTAVARVQRAGGSPPEIAGWQLDVEGFSGRIAEPFRDALKIGRRQREEQA